MASLKEIKGRIASVNSTLKVTSAMRLVASAKLRKAQNAIGNMLPYQSKLEEILSDLMSGEEASKVSFGGEFTSGRELVTKVALVCFSSNSSLCGAFNANAIRESMKAVADCKKSGVKELTVYSVGRKMADAMRKAGHPSPHDYTSLSAKPNYSDAAALGKELMDGFSSGRFDKVILVYNHFKSTSSQPTVQETYLPFGGLSEYGAESQRPKSAQASSDRGFIIEPSREEMVRIMLPKVLLLKIYTVLLDTSAAEHAARTIAMQTATDNGKDLLQDLTLEYNKSRQQKITNELLDLEGGASES